jgi:hypothetical protein
MSKNRVKLVRMAFQKVDKDGNGKLTVEDLKGFVVRKGLTMGLDVRPLPILYAPHPPHLSSQPHPPHLSSHLVRSPSVYDVRGHPKFKTGEMDEDQILGLFLASFDTPGQADGTVRRTHLASA